MDLETRYMNDLEYVQYIQALPDSQVSIIDVDGHARWVITPENGEKYILRPESTRVATFEVLKNPEGEVVRITRV